MIMPQAELLASVEHTYRTTVLYPAAEQQAAYDRILAEAAPGTRPAPAQRAWFSHHGRWVLQRRPA